MTLTQLATQPGRAPAPVLENVPASLRERPQWVVWRYEEPHGRLLKVPYAPRTERRASSANAETWSTYTEAAEVYFIANTSNQPESLKAAFRVEGMQPELWNPMDGRVSPAKVTETSAGQTAVDLKLAPYGSMIVAFTKRALPVAKPAPAPASVPQPLNLSTGWTVKFGKDGQPVPMDQLKSWTELDGRRNFSGVATYEKTVTIAPERELVMLLLVLYPTRPPTLILFP